MFSSLRHYKKPTPVWCLFLYLTQSIRCKFVLAQDSEFEGPEGFESKVNSPIEDANTLNSEASDPIAQINGDPLTAQDYLLPQQDGQEVTTSILSENEYVLPQQDGQAIPTSILRGNEYVLPQEDGQTSTFTSDGTVYVAEVFPTLTLTLTTIHNKVTYTTNILATSVVDKTSEYISYDYNFGQDTSEITHSSPVIHTTKEKSTVTKPTEKTTAPKRTYPDVVKTLYSEMNASKRWWKSVISESKAALATYVLGPVKTAPELYLTVSEVVSTFKIVSKGWMVHYVETIPQLVTLTARRVTHILTEHENVEYTLESLLESEWVSEQFLTIHGSTIVLYYTRYLTEEDGVVKTVTVGGTSTLDVETPIETLTTSDIYLTESTTTIGDSESDNSIGSDSSDDQFSTITDQPPEYSTVLTETAVTEEVTTDMMPLNEQQIPPDEVSSSTSSEAKTDFFTTPDIESDTNSINLISELTLTAITVGPYDQTTTVHTETTITTGTDGKDTPAIIYHVKTPAASTFSSVLTTVGPYNYTTTVLTETTHSVGTDESFSPGRVFHVDVPAAEQHSSATTTEGPYSFTTTVLTETTFTTGTDGSTIIQNIYHVNTPSTPITDSPLESADPTSHVASEDVGEVESNSTAIQVNNSSEGDNTIGSTTGNGSTVSDSPSLVTHTTTQIVPNVSTTTTVGPHSFTTTYHTEITYFVGPNGITTLGTIFHVKTPAKTMLTSTVITVGPYDSTTTKLTETTYVLGSDGVTTPEIVYHVRVPPVSVATSAITTVGPYAMATTFFTEETYIEGNDGNKTPELREHVNTPDKGFIATAPVPEDQGSVIHTSTEILVFTGPNGEEISSTAYHIFVAPTTDSTSVSVGQQEQQETEIHSTETLAVPSSESNEYIEGMDPMSMHQDDTQPNSGNASSELIDVNVSGRDHSMMAIYKTETSVHGQAETSERHIRTTGLVQNNDNGYPHTSFDDKGLGGLLTYFTGGGEPKGLHYSWKPIFVMALVVIL